MTSGLSDWAKEFLRAFHFAVLSTLNPDGSCQLTTMWYLLENDATIVMSTPGHLRKAKNLRRDPRIAIYVPDEAARPPTIEAIVQQGRISLRFTPEKVIEFSL